MEQVADRDQLFDEEEDKRIFVDDDNNEGPEADLKGGALNSKLQSGRDNAAEQTQSLSPKVKIHRNKKFESLAAQAQEDRERELKDLRQKAREEEKKEVEDLLNLPQPPVPKGWDYLILPRKINLERVPKPPTIMLDDYFAPVKELKLPLKARGIVFVFALTVITLMLTLLGVLVFRWKENTIWFVIGVDFIFAMAFTLLISESKSQLEEQKAKLTQKCQIQKEEDAAALAEEEKDYENNIAAEYRYFEFVNTIRLLSRELFTKVNPEHNGASRIESILYELREKLFTFNEHFTSRFLNTELRNADNFEDWSALRHLATVKELFATHIALLWMSVKHLNGTLKGSQSSTKEVAILRTIQKSVQSLLVNKAFLEEIVQISVDSDSKKTLYTVQELQQLLNTFESANKPSDDTQKLAQIQKLYLLINAHFAEKAGNNDFAQEFAEDEGDFLFQSQVKANGGFLNTSGVQKSSLLPDISPNKRDPRKDFVQIAHGEENHDNIDIKSDDQDEEDAVFANADIDPDFAYLRYHMMDGKAQREWKLEYAANNGNLKIYRRANNKGWSNITLKCIANLEHIPKHIIMKAIFDMTIRLKWDNTMGTLELLEHDKRTDQNYIKVSMNVPFHMQPRETVFMRKVMKDFPQAHSDTIVRKSVEHARAPLNLGKAARVDLRMSGMIIEEDHQIRGTKISWILSHDLFGSMPKSMLLQLNIGYQVKFIESLTKACQQIVKGKLK